MRPGKYGRGLTTRRYEFDARAWALKTCARVLQADGVPDADAYLTNVPPESVQACRRAVQRVINDMLREAGIRNHTRGARGSSDEDPDKLAGVLPATFDNGGKPR